MTGKCQQKSGDVRRSVRLAAVRIYKRLYITVPVAMVVGDINSKLPY